MIKLPKIALGTWAWGNDGTFGTAYTEDQLRPVFDSAMQHGLTLWDTAYAYGIGTAEKTLGAFLKGRARDSFLLSDKLTPQCMDESSASPVKDMWTMQQELLGIDDIDIYWVHKQLKHRSGSSALRHSSRKRNTRPSSAYRTTTWDSSRKQIPFSNIMD